MSRRKVTTTTLAAMRAENTPIVMATAYDATFAHLLESGGVDVLLVGDSLGMVIQGHHTTLPVTMDQMVYHTACVSRGAQTALIVGDLPFLAYQVSREQALQNAGRLLAEGGAHAVKLEGGASVAPTVAAMVEAGIPVMGHVGLTPQAIHQLGGFKAQGKDAEGARRIIEDAKALEAAGAFAIVLECVPGPLAKLITESVRIPTIGIGAGAGCSGQVLVCYDFLGLNEGFKPRFLKRFAAVGEIIREATAHYVQEVRQGEFPAEEHTISSPAPVPTAVDDPALELYGSIKNS